MGIHVESPSPVQEARHLAAAAHYGQWIGNIPYTGYLQRIEDILADHIELNSSIRTLIWLHDILNTPLTASNLVTRFSAHVCRMVASLAISGDSWEETQILRAQNAQEFGDITVAVLIAARIALLEQSTKGSMEHYRLLATHEAFRNGLGRPDDDLSTLWETLEKTLTD